MGAVFMKVPQILKIHDEKSAEGLKESMFYFDYLMLIQIAAFSTYDNLPFTVYGETLFLSIQDIIIIFQIWKYNNTASKIEMVLVSVGFFSYTLFLFANTSLTHLEWDIILSSSTFLNVLSKSR